MFDCAPRDYDSRDDERNASTSSRGSRGALTIATETTTGGNRTSDRASAMTTTPKASVAAQAMTGKPLMSTVATATMMHVGRIGTATVVSAIESRGIPSRGTSTCRADWRTSPTRFTIRPSL